MEGSRTRAVDRGHSQKTLRRQFQDVDRAPRMRISFAPPPTPPPAYAPPRTPAAVDKSGRLIAIAAGTQPRMWQAQRRDLRSPHANTGTFARHRSLPTIPTRSAVLTNDEQQQESEFDKIFEAPSIDRDGMPKGVTPFERSVLAAVFPSAPSTPQQPPSASPVSALPAVIAFQPEAAQFVSGESLVSRRLAGRMISGQLVSSVERTSVETEGPNVPCNEAPSHDDATIGSNERPTRGRTCIQATESEMSAFLVAHDRDHAHGKAISAVLARKLEGHIVQSREELERRLDEAIGVTDAANRPSLRALRHALKEKLERVVDILRRMDTDGNGTIDRAEFKEGIFGILGARTNCAGPDAPPMTELIANALRQSSNRLLDLFREWDADGDGDISRKEFHKAMPALGLEAPKADVDKLFDEWGGGDGTITYKEMSKVLKSKTKLKSHAIVWTRHDIDALFDVFDKDGDGAITYEELYAGLSVYRASRLYVDALLAGEPPPPPLPVLPSRLRGYKGEVLELAKLYNFVTKQMQRQQRQHHRRGTRSTCSTGAAAAAPAQPNPGRPRQAPSDGLKDGGPEGAARATRASRRASQSGPPRSDPLEGLGSFVEFLRLFYPPRVLSDSATHQLAGWVAACEQAQAEKRRLKEIEADAPLIEALDTDGSGMISITEFLGLAEQMQIPRSDLRMSFRQHDLCNFGELSVRDVAAALKELRKRLADGRRASVEQRSLVTLPPQQGAAPGRRTRSM